MAVEKWQTVVVTHSDVQSDEALRIGRLLTSGAADFVHIRKPDWSVEDVRRLITQIPADLHPRLRIHDFPELLAEFPSLGGLHLNRRVPTAPDGVVHLSKSMHSIDELHDIVPYDYVTLSPVFDSISKQGYASAFMPEILRSAALPSGVIALGGVTPESFPMLAAIGFSGGALLGYIWECSADQWEHRLEKLRRHSLMMKNFALQFITNAVDVRSTVSQVMDALAGGCRWIQIRMKDASDAEVHEVVSQVLPACRAAKSILLLDDRVELAAACGVDGVHLGKNDMPRHEARIILGENAIIGSTANTFDDIKSIAAAGEPDYIGLGPYRFTTTKKKLAPVLGVEGYHDIFSRMQEAGIYIPVVAIGGITSCDVEPILDAGASGVAVSGAICASADPVASTRNLIEIINKTLR